MAALSPVPTAQAEGHKVLVSAAVLIGAAYVFQATADLNPQMHELVGFLLLGVVLMLLMSWNAAGKTAALTAYPWVPSPGVAPVKGA